MASDLEECLVNLAVNKDERLCFLLHARQIAKTAGKIIKDFHGNVETISNKAEITDLVTETDKQVEKLIFDSLRNRFPGHKLIGEESVVAGTAIQLMNEPTWIVDPIDGTTNFVHQNPYTAVSIGLVINKKAEVGVVFAPILDEMYVAVKDNGAYLNGKKLNILNPPKCLSKSLIAFEWGAGRDHDVIALKAKNITDVIQKHKVRGVRSTGSAALNICMVAAGACDIYFEWGPHCWDVAAAHLCVKEAGGYNATTQGDEFDLMSCTIISAASRGLIDQLVPTLTQIPTKRDNE